MGESETVTAAAMAPPTGLPDNMPPINLPTVYAEFISSIYIAGGVVKFYLTRIDSPVIIVEQADVAQRLTPICQVIMPIEGVVNTSVFLSHYVENLVKSGTITQERVDAIRDAFTALTPKNA